jgi:hypothetical protein
MKVRRRRGKRHKYFFEKRVKRKRLKGKGEKRNKKR